MSACVCACAFACVCVHICWEKIYNTGIFIMALKLFIHASVYIQSVPQTYQLFLCSFELNLWSNNKLTSLFILIFYKYIWRAKYIPMKQK